MRLPTFRHKRAAGAGAEGVGTWAEGECLGAWRGAEVRVTQSVCIFTKLSPLGTYVQSCFD